MLGVRPELRRMCAEARVLRQLMRDVALTPGSAPPVTSGTRSWPGSACCRSGASSGTWSSIQGRRMRSGASRRRSTKGIASIVLSDMVVRQSTKSMHSWLISSLSLHRDTLRVDRADLMRLPWGLGRGRGTSRVAARRLRVEWSGTARSSPSRGGGSSRSALRSGAAPGGTRCAVSAPSGSPGARTRAARPGSCAAGSARQAAIASCVNQTVKLPR
jgi:hypothetical protein